MQPFPIQALLSKALKAVESVRANSKALQCHMNVKDTLDKAAALKLT